MVERVPLEVNAYQLSTVSDASNNDGSVLPVTNLKGLVTRSSSSDIVMTDRILCRDEQI